MEPQTLKDTTRRWITGIWDDGNLDLIDELTAEGYGFRLPRLGVTQRDDFPSLVSGFRSAFPDVNNTIEEQVVEGNVVVTRGTHEGPLGDVPASGKTIAVQW